MMYEKILEYYGISKEDHYYNEMLSNPKKHGLTYEAYEILII